MPLRNALDATSAHKLARLVSKQEIQVVHAHLARDYPLAAYAASRNPRAKLIVTRHVLFPFNRLHRLVLSRATRIIAVSRAVSCAIQVQKLVPAERIVVIPNGIDVDRFEQARAHFDALAFRRRWNIPEDHLLVGCVGELRPLKGHEDFLRAAAVIVRRFPKSYFLIAGADASPKGEHRAALQRLIADLDLGRHVRLFGWLDDLPAFYCALDVFVSASHTESFGLVIAEALASGTPIVATRTEGAAEILSPAESGVLVPVGDVAAIAESVTMLLLEPVRRQRLATTGVETAQSRFSVARMIEETELVYREALGEQSIAFASRPDEGSR